MWKDILKKDSRITTHRKKGKKEIDTRYRPNDPTYERHTEVVDGERVASAQKMPRPPPYRGTKRRSNRVEGDYDTATERATLETIEFLRKRNNYEKYIAPLIGKDKFQSARDLEENLKGKLEDTQYEFINWDSVLYEFGIY